MKSRTVIFILIALLSLSIAVPAIAFAQDFVSPDMLPPVAMMAFGFVGLVGGTIGYFWRQNRH